MGSASRGSRPDPSASHGRSVGTDSATITKVKVCFAINYVCVPATTSHD